LRGELSDGRLRTAYDGAWRSAYLVLVMLLMMCKIEDELCTRECCDEEWKEKASACKHSRPVSDCCESGSRSLSPSGKANDKVDGI
jgi:hypothetical protein